MKVIHKLVSGVLLAICTVSSAFAAGESTEIDMMTAFFKAVAVHTQNMSIPLVSLA